MHRTAVPRGAARREAILRATIQVIGEQGPGAVTHRAVAARADVPLSATTYWFASKEELLEETLRYAMRQETDRLERVVLDLAPRALEVEAWAAALASILAADLEADPITHIAFNELAMEAARRPELRAEMERWEKALLRLAEVGTRVTGSDDPETDARLVVSAITGLMVNQLVSRSPDFEREILRPALERLFTRLTSGGRVPA